MPKRKSTKENKWRRKIRKYEERIKRNRPSLSFEDERDSSMSAPSSPNAQRGRHCQPRDITPDPSSYHRSPPSRVDTPPPLEPEMAAATAPPPLLATSPAPLPATSPPLLPATSLTHISDDIQTGLLQSELSLEVDASPSADPELLQALGIFEAEKDEWGPEIVEELARRWQPLLKDGLKKEEKDQIHKKYPFPKNCPLIKPPTLNPEISAVLNESAKNRDGRLEKKQAQLGYAFTILGRTMSNILTKSINTPEVLKNLSDMAKILADAHYSETETRRALIIPMVDKTFIEPFKNRKRDSHLFGEKLGEFIKSSRVMQKTGKLMQPTTTINSSNLNSKGPASRYQQQRPSRQAHRAGETRASQYQQYRRRAPFQPGLNNRAPPLPLVQTTSALPAAPPNRKQVAAPTYKRRQ